MNNNNIDIPKELNSKLKNKLPLNEEKTITPEQLEKYRIESNKNFEEQERNRAIMEERLNNPKCEYCGKPYFKYYKESGGDGYYYTETVFKPVCKCDFIHLSKEEKEKEILYNLANSGLTPVLLKKSFDNLMQTEELKQCREYAEQFIKQETKGIKLIGDNGTGKTVAIACICKYLIENGYKCYFTTLSKILGDYSNYSYDNHGKIADKLEELNNIDLLVLDDIGREKLDSDTKKENFFSIIDYLINYEIKLAFTCNPELYKKLINKQNNMPELKAIIDRFNELCPNVIYFDGPSFRGNI